MCGLLGCTFLLLCSHPAPAGEASGKEWGGGLLVSDLHPQPSNSWSRSVHTGRTFPEVTLRSHRHNPWLCRVSWGLGMRKELREPWAAIPFPREEVPGASSQGGSPAVSTCLVSPSPSRFCGWWTELLRASELHPPPLLPIWLGIRAFLFSLESQGPVSIPGEGVPSSAREREGRGGSSWRRRAGPEAKPERKALPANEG